MYMQIMEGMLVGTVLKDVFEVDLSATTFKWFRLIW
jgi:hypothetical protein